MKTLVSMLMLATLWLGCTPVRNSPFSEEVVSKVRNKNQAQFKKLDNHARTFDDSITFAVIADSHQNYSDLEDWVKSANELPFDFSVSLGDVTNQGMNFEYDAYLSIVGGLSKPHFTVIGNHDTLTKGKLLYRRLIGDFNSSFLYRGYKFVLFNNNSLDFYPEDLDWNFLENEIRDSEVPVILFMHIGPNNKDYFKPAQQEKFWNIISKGDVRLIMNGHSHVFETERHNGVLRHQVHRTQGVLWSRITLTSDSVTVEICRRKVCSYDTEEVYSPSTYVF